MQLACVKNAPLVLQQAGHHLEWQSGLYGSCMSLGGASVDARRPAAESSVAECRVLAACACQKHWSYTTRNTSETYAFNGTCANPGGDRMAAWCPVDAGTCAHQPRQGRIVSKGPYNLCNAERDTTTLDTRAPSAHLALPRDCQAHSLTDEALLNKIFACMGRELDSGGAK